MERHTPATKEKFSGYRVLAGLVLYMFSFYGLVNVMTVAFGKLPEYYNVSLTVVVTGGSICTFLSFCGGFIASRFMEKLTPRGAMVFGSFSILIFCWLIAFFRHWVMLYIAQAVLGFAMVTCLHACLTSVAIKWFVKNQSTVISVVMASAIFGAAFAQYVSGILFERLGVSRLYLYAGILVCALCLFSALVLVRNSPESVGQKALGWDLEVGTQTSAPVDVPQSPPRASIYRDPVFWIIALAVFLGCLVIAGMANYATTFFPQYGLSFSQASLVLSIANLIGGVFIFFSGKIIDKLGVKPYTILIFSGGILVNCALFLLARNVIPYAILLVPSIIGYALASPVQSISNQISVPVFGSQATAANAQLMGFMYGGNALMIPLVTNLTGPLGFGPVFMIIAGVSCVCLILYLAAFRMAHRRSLENSKT